MDLKAKNHGDFFMKNKNKLFFIIGLCLISLSCFVISGTMSTLASNMAGWSDSGLNSNYAYKSELTIKDRTYSDGTKSYDASSITCYPDGSVTTDKTVTLNQAGVYEVKYSVSANGKVYANSKNSRSIIRNTTSRMQNLRLHSERPIVRLRPV